MPPAPAAPAVGPRRAPPSCDFTSALLNESPGGVLGRTGDLNERIGGVEGLTVEEFGGGVAAAVVVAVAVAVAVAGGAELATGLALMLMLAAEVEDVNVVLVAGEFEAGDALTVLELTRGDLGGAEVVAVLELLRAACSRSSRSESRLWIKILARLGT
jgi:hypothetical protein